MALENHHLMVSDQLLPLELCFSKFYSDLEKSAKGQLFDTEALKRNSDVLRRVITNVTADALIAFEKDQGRSA